MVHLKPSGQKGSRPLNLNGPTHAENLNDLMFICIPLFPLYRYVCARPAGKRCFVVSSNGTTVSRLRNGSMLHRFPSALPNGARTNNSSRSGQSYCILDCIFHEVVVFSIPFVWFFECET